MWAIRQLRLMMDPIIRRASGGWAGCRSGPWSAPYDRLRQRGKTGNIAVAAATRES